MRKMFVKLFIFALAVLFFAPVLGTVAEGAEPAGEVLFYNGNIYGVQSGPNKATSFRVSVPTVVTSITTYHYFGKGAAPGSIQLVDSAGRSYGHWRAAGRAGQGGVANAYWDVNINVTLPPGTYFIKNSNPSTWSYNAASGGAGFTWVRGYAGTVAQKPPAKPTEPKPTTPQKPTPPPKPPVKPTEPKPTIKPTPPTPVVHEVFSLQADKTEIRPGDTVLFTATNITGDKITDIRLVDSADNDRWPDHEMSKKANGKYQVSLEFPDDFSGEKTFFVVADIGKKGTARSAPFKITASAGTSTIPPATPDIPPVAVTPPPPPIPLATDMGKLLSLKIKDGDSKTCTEGNYFILQIESQFEKGSLDISGFSAGTTYQSDNEEVAAVYQDGSVEALKPGSATITAMNQNVTATIVLTVQKIDPAAFVPPEFPDDPFATDDPADN